MSNAPSLRGTAVGFRVLATALMAVLGVYAWQSLGTGSRWELTYQGNRVQNGLAVLESAERFVHAEAKPNSGVVPDASSRCYFISAPGDTGHVPVPITDQAACGPLKMVSGGVEVPYLDITLKASAPRRGHVSMSVDRSVPPVAVSSPPLGQRLVRPDGVKPNDGAGDLERPGAPPAIGDVLTTARDVSPAPPTSSAAMIGRVTGVRLTAFGRVDTYGAGASTRSAPVNRELIAFRAQAIPGEYGSNDPELYLRIDGRRRGPLKLTADWIVAAIPTTSHDVALVLSGEGVDQSLSLLDGSAGSTNPTVTTRANAAVSLNVQRPVNVRVRTAKGTGTLSGRVTLTSVSLLYWAPDGSHAAGPDRALLQIVATLDLAGDRTHYGVEPELLSAAATGESMARARNAAPKGKTEVVAVVDVPANITTGTISFGGSTSFAGKGTLTVPTMTFAFAFPQG